MLDLLARHALDGGGDLRGQRGGLATADGDHAQFFHGGMAGGAVSGLGECGHGPDDREGKDEGKGAGHGQRHAAFAHGNS